MPTESRLATLDFVPRELSDEKRTALEDALARILDEAHAAFPTVVLPDDVFLAHLHARAAPWDDQESLSKLHANDLYLACACSLGNATALAIFEQRCLGGLERALMRITRNPSVIDEVRQQLRVKLFVRGEREPRIVDYTGRGALAGWVRVAAIRTALNLVQRQNPASPTGATDEPLLGTNHIESEYVKLRHAREFEAAFRASLAALTVKQRNLMRLHYCDDLTLAQIGRLHSVHESTVSRWLLAGRDELLSRTRAELCARLRVTQNDVDSLMAQLVSRADLSLRTLFAEAGP